MGITAAIGAIGVGLSAAGTATSISAASAQASAQQAMITQQQEQERLRKRQMELDARRRQMELFRQQQRARSLALTTATAQGAMFGTGLQGGYGQISGQYGTQSLGVSQNLEIGRGLFASNMLESQAKMDYASAGADAAFGAGLSSLGGTIISNLGTLANLTARPTSVLIGNPSTYNPSRIGSLY